MIRRIRLIRSIGNLESVDTCRQIDLGQLVLFYGENGRGKTTLAAVFRSLATGEPNPIQERRSLTSDQQPKVVLDCDGDPPKAVFHGGQWNRKLPQLRVFDDTFVDENVHSGLFVESRHRKNLHGVILGSHGVKLQRQLEQIVDRAKRHNSELRVKRTAIPESVRFGFTVDRFCELTMIEDVDSQIRETERELAAARDQDAVSRTPLLEPIDLPDFDSEAIDKVLGRSLADLDATADARVRAHFESLGPGGEQWVASGMQRLSPSVGKENCPFCAQDLSASNVIGHYRVYFSEEYSELKRSIDQALQAVQIAHDGDAVARFERAVSAASQGRVFWSRLCEVTQFEVDSDLAVRNWKSIREGLLELLRAKRNTPLERVCIPKSLQQAMSLHKSHRKKIEEYNRQMAASNTQIRGVKEKAAAANPELIHSRLNALRARKSRHMGVNMKLCDEYLAEKKAKEQTDQDRAITRQSLSEYRDEIFPELETSINSYLDEFSAGFKLAGVEAVDISGGASCTYSIEIHDRQVDVARASADGQPSFSTTLSSGDRNTLALAFFFAALEHDPDLSRKVVIIDDPKSSLDDHRSLTTVQVARRFAERVEQMMILSHDKRFLCNVWSGFDRSSTRALEIARDGTGSILREWPVHEESVTEHDRRHVDLLKFVDGDTGNKREIARSLRPHLEGFLRVACPGEFPPEAKMGNFLHICRERIGQKDEVLNNAGARELSEMLEYANRFHHDTNPAWREEIISDAELLGFVTRVLAFARP
ncbi:MAG: AAA family ATPase [Chloroflexota bacterium]|nr:AAA family ATPase [Chloroflexota bacterium]